MVSFDISVKVLSVLSLQLILLLFSCNYSVHTLTQKLEEWELT